MAIDKNGELVYKGPKDLESLKFFLRDRTTEKKKVRNSIMDKDSALTFSRTTFGVSHGFLKFGLSNVYFQNLTFFHNQIHNFHQA